MRAEKRQDRSSLGWIRGDLDQSLDEVRIALEAVLDGDKARVQDCLDGLHHIHGVLDLVQVYGGAMLAERDGAPDACPSRTVKTTRLDGAAEALMLGGAAACLPGEDPAWRGRHPGRPAADHERPARGVASRRW
jgi:chemosensory pili system protein ChpA (sensor histidine kinase/response regulator)